MTVASSALEAHDLTKRYGNERGVAEVSFAVKPGEICALLGPNGAGKTTSMRMLVGLARPDRGSGSILGRPSHLAADVLARVGVLIDGPAFVPHLSGLRNLKLLWRAGGREWPPPALEASLALAGLGSAIDRKVKRYSMGMRQRLTLAQALMGAPNVLVLDEPANGLDPGEVRALRKHLAGLAAKGGSDPGVQSPAGRGRAARQPRRRTRSGSRRVLGPTGSTAPHRRVRLRCR